MHPQRTLIEAAEQVALNEEDKKNPRDLFQKVHGVNYESNSNMYFHGHYGEHPEHGKLFMGKSNMITNNPKRAKPQGGPDAEIPSQYGQIDRRYPLANLPTFVIDGQKIPHGSDQHTSLVDHIRTNPIDLDPVIGSKRKPLGPSWDGRIDQLHQKAWTPRTAKKDERGTAERLRSVLRFDRRPLRRLPPM